MVMKYGLDETEIENGCGLIEFNRRGVICKRISDIKLSFSECICSELTLLKNKWLCFSIYRPPFSSKLSIFFEEISVSLSKVILKYQNIIIMGDFNLDLKTKGIGFNKLDEF